MSRLEDTQPIQPVGLPIHDEVLAEQEERRQLIDRLEAAFSDVPPTIRTSVPAPRRGNTLFGVLILALVILASVVLLAAVTVHTR